MLVAFLLTRLTPKFYISDTVHDLGLQELRSRGVAREHIDAALSSVFGDGKQLPAREPGNPAEEGGRAAHCILQTAVRLTCCAAFWCK